MRPLVAVAIVALLVMAAILYRNPPYQRASCAVAIEGLQVQGFLAACMFRD